MTMSITASDDLAFTSVGSLTLSGAEISAYDAASRKLFVTSNTGLQIVDLGDPSAPTLVSTIAIATLSATGGDVTSVAVRNGVVAVSVADQVKSNAGTVVLLDAATGTILKSLAVGALPDMLTFTPDGLKVLVANEAEVVSDADFGGNGSVSIIDLSGGVAAATVQTAGFTAFNGQEDALRAQGVRIWAGKTVAEDVEPEYIAVSPDGTKAMVTLQEANAVAILDIATATFTAIVPLGTKDFSSLMMDPSDRDGPGNTTLTNLVTGLPVKGLYMPDAISSYASGGQTYYVISNEGDDRDDFLAVDETIRVGSGSYDLDNALFPNEATLKTNAQLGRLTVSNAPGLRGDTDGDGDIDQILMYGGRSFSILDSNGNIVFDSGDAIERIVAAEFPALLDDTRSDNKGPEPEGVTVASIGGRAYAFVGLERSHLTLAFDVTDPANVTYTGALRHDGDLNPEGGLFIPAADSPTGAMLFVSTNEVSTNLSVFEVAQPFRLQLLHLSDGEAGLLADETAPNLAALVDAFDDDYANTLILSGGDNFLPGPFTNASTDPSLNAIPGIGTTGVGRPDIAIHNVLGVEASAIGNHEFDLGSTVLRDAFTPSGAWQGAQFPYLSSNLDFSGDSALSPRYTNTVDGSGATPIADASTLKGRIAPAAVVTEGGQKIGIVGATTQVLESISSPNGTEVKGFPAGPGANGEVDDMDLLAAQLQPIIDEMIAEGINKIVVVSHLQNLANEEALAPKLRGVDIILSAGSHTRLGDADDVPAAFPGHDADFAATYPIVTQGADGKTTVIVGTDGEYTYLGRLVVDFDANGEIILDSLAANVDINGAYASTAENVAEAWGVEVDELDTTAFANGTKGGQVLAITDAVDAVISAKDGNIFGYTNVYLEGDRTFTRAQETNLGNITADANLWKGQEAGGAVYMVSLKNGGGIRAQIGSIDPSGEKDPPVANPDAGKPQGAISQLDIENALRFDNRLMVFDTTAQGLKNILEHGVTLPAGNGGYAQLGGVRVAFDPTRPAGQRVTDIALVDLDGNLVARVWQDGSIAAGAPATISVTALNFTANGGDGYPIKANGTNFRYLLTDGTLSAAVDPALDFTALATMQTVGQTLATVLGEQKALQDFLQEFHGTPDMAYDQADTPTAMDERIENLGVRGNVVFGRVDNGTTGDDTITGSDTNDMLSGRAGKDVLLGGAADDTISGGDGNDQVDGGKGLDALFGGAGADLFMVRTGDVEAGEIYDGGAGVDTVSLVDGARVDLSGAFLLGIEKILGSNGDDRIVLSASQALSLAAIEGGAGDDWVSIVLAGTVDATSSQRPEITGIETLTALGSAGADKVTVTASQFASFSAVDLAAGKDAITVVVSGEADFTAGMPALTGIETVSLVGAGSVRLTVQQLGAFTSIAPGLVVTLADTGAALAALKPAALAQLAARGVDRIDATDNHLSLSVAKLQALGPVALTGSDHVVLRDLGAQIQALTPAEIAQLAARGVDAIDAGNDKLSLSLAQFNALGKVALTASDVVALADTGANLAALKPAALAQLAARGVDRIDATDNHLSLSVAKLQALGPVALTASDHVVLRDLGAQIQALTPAEIAQLAARGVDAIDAGNGKLSLSIAQFNALGKVALTASDVVTLADTGANLAALMPAALAQLAARGVDRIDATDDVLSLSVAKLQALGPVALAAADQVVLRDTGAQIQALTPAEIAQLGAKGVDVIDASNGNLMLSLAQFNALGKVALTASDAVTLVGTAGDDALSFARQILGPEDRVDGGGGFDRLVLSGDYSAGLSLQPGALTDVEWLAFGRGFDYALALADANVDAGQVLTVSARGLGSPDSLIFDGSQETDGSFVFLAGGPGTTPSTTFTGGSKADIVVAGFGNDTIVYSDPNQSTSLNYDTVRGFDFAADKFDVAGAITSVATVSSGKLGIVNFDTDLASAMNGVLDADGAALFTPTTFALQGSTFMVIDQNGLAGYQSGGDLVLRLEGPVNLGAFGVDLFV
ncbi:MAG: choice-of-anchor I family protein [Reyranella sp.]